MLALADLPDDIQHAIGDRNLIVFDVECLLCEKFFDFVLKHDKGAVFHFATAQSDVGQSLYKALNLPTRDFETLVVVLNGHVYTKLDAAILVCARLTIWGRLVSVVRLFPRAFKDALYDFVARRRFGWFGRSETCLIPDAQLQDRFLSNEFRSG